MKKMREVKERKQSDEVGADLRGLGWDPLLQDSAPYAFLAVHGASEHLLQALADKYRLETTTSMHADVTHLRAKVREAGMHKEQAVFLLGAAIEIHHNVSTAHMYLGQVSNLHHHLAAAMSKDELAKKHSADGQIRHWIARPTTMTIEAAVALHLQQAGVKLAMHSENLQLQSNDIIRLHAELTGSIAHQSRGKQRRAG